MARIPPRVGDRAVSERSARETPAVRAQRIDRDDRADMRIVPHATRGAFQTSVTRRAKKLHVPLADFGS